MTWVAAAVGGASLVGGAISAFGSKSAANTQASAARYAADIGKQEFNTITKQEQPFMQGGYNALSALQAGLGIGPQKGSASYGSLISPFTIDKFHQFSPAYQFQQQQGMQGVLGQASGSVGAESGAAQKDLIDYNQGLANTSFNNAFNQYQTQQGNIYQRLAGVAQMGQAAATNTGQQGTALAGNIAQSVTNAGSAQAAGQVGQANAWSGALSGAAPWLAYGGGGSQAPAGWSVGGQTGNLNYQQQVEAGF